jgi:hypothetical protein
MGRRPSERSRARPLTASGACQNEERAGPSSEMARYGVSPNGGTVRVHVKLAALFVAFPATKSGRGSGSRLSGSPCARMRELPIRGKEPEYRI